MAARLRTDIGRRILTDGGIYEHAYDAFMSLLATQGRKMSIAARYAGGVHVRRDRVEDADRAPTAVVSAAE